MIHQDVADIIAREDRAGSGLYQKRPYAFVRGAGALLWDAQGREYIDCASGHGVANVGHCHPKVVQAIQTQAACLLTSQEAFYNDQRAALSTRLAALRGEQTRVFLCNSGTESVEAAIKLARWSTGRSQVVAAMRGFHGRTLGALSATWDKKYREPFEPLVPGFVHLPYNDLEALGTAVGDQTAAVLLEVVQGEGGVRLGEAAFLKEAQRICRANGALLIVDEVQTGFGRTGRFFAFEHYDLDPDLICIAKAMAGGVPMGAVLLGHAVREPSPGLHASTFGGNPLACAAALATLEVMEEENLVAESARKGASLTRALEGLEIPLVREIRGLGLMIGIELKRKSSAYLAALLEAGVVALPAGINVIRLLPPLVIRDDQIDRVVEALSEVLSSSPPD